MKILVSDTSVLIDLDRGGLTEEAFRLPYEFAVPDLLYVAEIEKYDGAELIDLGLRIEELDGPGVNLALEYRRKRRTLSLPDAFALALASRHSWVLLAGDKELRKLAEAENIECHGVLWLMDRIFENGVVSGAQLRSSLARIAAHPRCRLPQAEVRRRLVRYSGA
ncbi:MAG: hypothetical protein OXF43_08440 [Gammaproteobacteria bacterium]|nr:hypothetical protein [Gammaproteobacteria bacterium]